MNGFRPQYSTINVAFQTEFILEELEIVVAEEDKF